MPKQNKVKHSSPYEIGISKKSDLMKKSVITGLIVVVFLLASIISGVFLVRQQQNVAERAAVSNMCPGAEACPYAKDPTHLWDCHPPDPDGTVNDHYCATKGVIATCGAAHQKWCCPGAGAAWTTNLSACPVTPTPTPIATPTPPPSPPGKPNVTLSCNGSIPSGLITWTGTPNAGFGFKVDISESGAFDKYWIKTVGNVYTTTLSGFLETTTTQGVPFSLQVGHVYYVLIENGSYGVPSDGFIISSCGGTPTPIPTPTVTPTPTPIPTKTPTGTPVSTKTPTATPVATKTPTSTPISTNTPTPTPTGKYADVNGDGLINIIDIGIIVDNYGSSNPQNPRADINKDGIVNIIDIGIVVDNYGK